MDNQVQLAVAKQGCAYHWYHTLAELLLPKDRLSAVKVGFTQEGAEVGSIHVTVPEFNQFVVLCRARQKFELAQYLTTMLEEFSQVVMDDEHDIGKCLKGFVDQAMPITNQSMAIIQDSLDRIEVQHFHAEQTNSYLFLMEIISLDSNVLEEAGIVELIEQDAAKFSNLTQFIEELTTEKPL